MNMMGNTNMAAWGSSERMERELEKETKPVYTHDIDQAIESLSHSFLIRLLVS